jgi:Kdo2-lipid IVA lauroyltransferase/acyltransferase
MRSAWKRLRYRLEWLGLRLAAALVPLLPQFFWMRLARVVGSTAFVVDGHARRVAIGNLEAAFGERFSKDERRKMARESFQHFSRTMLELLWSPHLNSQNLSRYIEMVNADEIKRLGSAGHFIMAVYHYSNWEWLGAACGYGLTGGTIISQEFKNSLLDPIFKDLRERAGHEFIPRHRGIVRMYKALKRNRAVAMLIDLTLPPRDGAVVIDCFGLKTSVAAAHAWLHKQTGAPIFPAHAEPLPGGRYRIIFHPAIRDAQGKSEQEIAQMCWDGFQPYVERNPAPWLWMYKHWRYKPSKTDREYPFYAQTLPRFDRMISEADAVRESGD